MKRSSRTRHPAKKKAWSGQPWTLASHHTLPNPETEAVSIQEEHDHLTPLTTRSQAPPTQSQAQVTQTTPAMPELVQMPPNGVQPQPSASNIISSDDDSDEDPMDGAVEAYLNSLLPQGNLQPISTPIISQIKPSIANKIWRNIYIDFTLLLPSAQNSNKFAIQMDKNAQLCIIPTHQAKKIPSIDQWTTAFFRFAAVYLIRRTGC
ncbi:uncharacterized protein LOC128213977 [Mya arenaria]|nr:uncharacterized protein LOC128213977 [Mya arenaria]